MAEAPGVFKRFCEQEYSEVTTTFPEPERERAQSQQTPPAHAPTDYYPIDTTALAHAVAIHLARVESEDDLRLVVQLLHNCRAVLNRGIARANDVLYQHPHIPAQRPGDNDMY